MFLFVWSSTSLPTHLPCLLRLMTINFNLYINIVRKMRSSWLLISTIRPPSGHCSAERWLTTINIYIYYNSARSVQSSWGSQHQTLWTTIEQRPSRWVWSFEITPGYSRVHPALVAQSVKLKYKNKESFWHQELLKNTLSLLNLTHVYQHFFEIRGFLKAKENSLEIMEIYFESCVVV